MDDEGRVLLVRQTDFGSYGTIGGAVDEDEAPEDAARREAREEIGAEVEITGLLGAVGGPQFRVTYPNGDQCAYVSIIYGARLAPDAEISPDGQEVDQVRWFDRDDLDHPTIGAFARSTFAALGWL